MRHCLSQSVFTRVFAVLLVLAAVWPAAAEEAAKPVPIVEILPEGTIILAEIKPCAQWSRDFSQTALANIFGESEVKEFLAGPLSQISQLFKRILPAQLEEKKEGEKAPAEAKG